jgi:hypothetical protein
MDLGSSRLWVIVGGVIMGFVWQGVLLLWLVTVCVVMEARVLLSAKNHRFVEGENVPLFANKVLPFHNPRYVDARSGSNCSFVAVQI